LEDKDVKRGRREIDSFHDKRFRRNKTIINTAQAREYLEGSDND